MKYETQLFGGQANLHCMKQTLRNEKSNSHSGIRLAICIACLLFHSEKLSHVTLLRNTGQYFSTQKNRMIDEDEITFCRSHSLDACAFLCTCLYVHCSSMNYCIIIFNSRHFATAKHLNIIDFL